MRGSRNMSNRANAIKYGGSGGGNRTPARAPRPGGFGTKPGALTIDPVTGEPSFTPQTVAHPLLDRIFNQGGATAAASQFNNQMMMQQYIDALQRQQEKLKGQETRKTVAATGSENRLTDAQKQRLDWMTSRGLPYTDDNFSRADKVLSGQITENEMFKEINKYNTLTDPNYQQAFIRGQTAEAEAPVFKNYKMSEVNTGPDSITSSIFPKGYQPTLQIGPTVEQGLVESSPDIMGTRKSFPVRNVTPGKFLPPVDSSVLQQAGKVAPPSADVSPDGMSGGFDMQDPRMQIIMQMLMGGGMGGMGSIKPF